MSVWKIAWRSIQQRALASSLTGISMALGVMLVVAVLVIQGAINQSFLNNSGLGYNIVVGAKGGRLDLVLNAVYYLARPIENIPYSYYLEFTEGKFSPSVQTAIPLCMGDTYQDFRVIGTTPDFFDKLDYGGNKYEFAEGRNFKADEFFGAVVGATVARETGLKRGDTFQPSHSGGPEAHVHEEQFVVQGVLEPTGTPNDRGLFINMEGFYLIPEHKSEDEPLPAGAPAHEHDAHEGEGHDEDVPAHEGDHKHEADHEHEGEASQETNKAEADGHGDGEHPADHAHEEKGAAQSEHKHDAAEGQAAGHTHEHEDAHEHADEHSHEHADSHGHDHAHEPVPLEQREVTAVLVLTASVAGAPPELLAPGLMKRVNEGSVAQAALPIREMSTLFTTFVDPLRIVLLSLTVLIVIVAGIGILVSIYNSMSERRHEIAVIRALGAGRRTVMFIVLAESILLSLAGGLAGWVVGHGLIGLVNPWITERTGVSIHAMQFVGYELVIIPGLIVLAAVVGYLPAVAAYRTDVAKALSATP